MENAILFDVLIVYTHSNAISAMSKLASTPFRGLSSRAHYNNAYAYFLEMCAQNNLSAAFTTTRDLLPGKVFKAYWVYRNSKWSKVNKKCRSRLVFDKFSSNRDYLFLNSQIKSFTSPTLFSVFFDKQKTYQYLKDFTVPTVPLLSTDKLAIQKALMTLKMLIALHPNNSDFASEIIVKDRFGAGGNKIYVIGKVRQCSEILKILNQHRNTSFIIQPFTKFENGFKYKNYNGFIDIRLIYLKNKVIQAYIRVAKPKDFRCNEHQGGILEYIPLADIPKKVLGFSKQIVDLLDEKSTLYALDFVISDNANVYLMEGNNCPGIDWNLSLRKNEQMAKKLIRLIIIELALRVRRSEKDVILPQVIL
ncbi:MAG: hypothetical protein US96_C0007G0024 [Candidatus Woesebacteria bacterium GW2011_GWB1_38_5b]|uniref:ATP-grasp domain-containing protein n=1 Tax=Candidatus Woesebacteria bacterium GW2011_GWB1_38_5b TaxID=1618569 RepID=A0A0G0NF16_9BACT|nr:MAG: hypothetical protein US96_C0007G0024 [Candidatus Woesebacteria bacterium GW2011_GWB1_38_5b]